MSIMLVRRRVYVAMSNLERESQASALIVSDRCTRMQSDRTTPTKRIHSSWATTNHWTMNSHRKAADDLKRRDAKNKRSVSFTHQTLGCNACFNFLIDEIMHYRRSMRMTRWMNEKSCLGYPIAMLARSLLDLLGHFDPIHKRRTLLFQRNKSWSS